MTDILNGIITRRRKDMESKTVPVLELKARHWDRTGFRPFHQALKQNMVCPGMCNQCNNMWHYTDNTQSSAEITRLRVKTRRWSVKKPP